MKTNHGKQRTYTNPLQTGAIAVLAMLMLISSAAAEVRLKDVVLIKDQREIQLKGVKPGVPPIGFQMDLPGDEEKKH